MKKIHVHILIWLGLFTLRFFTMVENESIIDSLISSLPMYLCFAVVFYTSAFLHKRYFESRRHFLYAIFLLGTVLLGTIFVRIFSKIVFFYADTVFQWGVVNLAFFRILFFALSGVFYQVTRGKREAEDKNRKLELEKRETELLFLKSQINPHFFFNTLNNIYGLAYRKDDNAHKAIIKLSEAMRYVIYETESSFVPLQKELSFIDNYIDLERLRLVNKENLKYNNEVGFNSGKIAPLILLPFIENCFKHSNIDDDENSEIEISIWTEEDYLFLSCGNTVSKRANYKEGGLGTGNVKKRLEMLYGDRFSLFQESNEFSYYISLKIPLENK